ncbi:MAG: hypothetical protein QM619_11035 [Micropruina sp.]|uniref:hypothetical protein n=1 Tax=Micropruina sp. TaxID=2737536 RepID=UPI0039E2657A
MLLMKIVSAMRASVVAIAIVCSSCGCTSNTPQASPSASSEKIAFHADYPNYPSLEAALSTADAVVAGTLLGSREDLLRPDVPTDIDSPLANPQAGTTADRNDPELTLPVTIATIKVTQTMKGAVKVGTTIDVTQYGGKKNGTLYQELDTVLFHNTSAKEFVLLLRNQGDRFNLINPTQGAWARTGNTLAGLTNGTASPYDVHTIDEVTKAASKL